MNIFDIILVVFSIFLVSISIFFIKKVSKTKINEKFNNSIFQKRLPNNVNENDSDKDSNRIHTLSQNKCNLDCCSRNSSYTCSHGCVCLSNDDEKLLKISDNHDIYS